MFALSQHAVAFAQSQLISKIVNGPDYLLISPLDAPPAGTTYRKRTEDSLPTGSGNREVLLQLPELQNIAGKCALIYVAMAVVS